MWLNVVEKEAFSKLEHVIAGIPIVKITERAFHLRKLQRFLISIANMKMEKYRPRDFKKHSFYDRPDRSNQCLLTRSSYNSNVLVAHVHVRFGLPG